MQETSPAKFLRHYRRAQERPFTAEERRSTTILFGGLTQKHEAFIRAVFRGGGYRFENLPVPTRQSFQLGKEYCNNGLCNPNYFTAGNLIRFLHELELSGLTRQEILDRYVYFTPADCGPCRFGMYESEYRQALQNAGFGGFRVITFKNSTVFGTGCDEPGLKFTADMGFGIFNAIILADLLYEIAYNIRPYEIDAGSTDEAVAECVDWLSDFLSHRVHFEIDDVLPDRLLTKLEGRRAFRIILQTVGKFRRHLYSPEYRQLLWRCAKRLDQVKVDRLRPKPVVKVVGEFYSHFSENDANYNMFHFLESEGAQVGVDSLTNLILYWLYKAKLNHLRRVGLRPKHQNPRFWQVTRRLANVWESHKKPLLFWFGDRLYTRQYHRTGKHLGGFGHPLIEQRELARLARSYYNPLTRGGEGHLEVGKSIYCTREHLCHMVLSLKPFGCMPSTQSDGVMAAVTSHYDDLLFVSVETSGDGDINAFSRVQMALADAKKQARAEFDKAIEGSGRTLEEIRGYVEEHPEISRPSYRIPEVPGIACLAAQLVVHVAGLMKRGAR
jgi:predicted nucleotide-binding protein (sugar kinase/HSP70/actin superfamily)